MSESCRRLIVLLNTFFKGEAWVKKILLKCKNWSIPNWCPSAPSFWPPCPAEGTFPSWKFSHGRCLPIHSSSGSREWKDSLDTQAGRSNFLEQECKIVPIITHTTTLVITWWLDSCILPNASLAGGKQPPGLNSTVTCPFKESFWLNMTFMQTQLFSYETLDKIARYFWRKQQRQAFKYFTTLWFDMCGCTGLKLSCIGCNFYSDWKSIDHSYLIKKTVYLWNILL